MSSPQWTDPIADTTLCGYFYVFFVIYSVLAALAVIGAVYMLATTKITGGLVGVVLFSKLISIGILGTTALFLYLICERALKPAAKAQQRASSGPSLMM